MGIFDRMGISKSVPPAAPEVPESVRESVRDEANSRLLEAHNHYMTQQNAVSGNLTDALNSYGERIRQAGNGPPGLIPGTENRDQAQSRINRPVPIYKVDLSERKMSKSMTRLADELPMNVAANIKTAEFRQDPATKRIWVEIVFRNDKPLAFDNVDTFPTDSDVSLIILTCP